METAAAASGSEEQSPNAVSIFVFFSVLSAARFANYVTEILGFYFTSSDQFRIMQYTAERVL